MKKIRKKKIEIQTASYIEKNEFAISDIRIHKILSSSLSGSVEKCNPIVKRLHKSQKHDVTKLTPKENKNGGSIKNSPNMSAITICLKFDPMSREIFFKICDADPSKSIWENGSKSSFEKPYEYCPQHQANSNDEAKMPDKVLVKKTSNNSEMKISAEHKVHALNVNEHNPVSDTPKYEFDENPTEVSADDLNETHIVKIEKTINKSPKQDFENIDHSRSSENYNQYHNTMQFRTPTMIRSRKQCLSKKVPISQKRKYQYMLQTAMNIVMWVIHLKVNLKKIQQRFRLLMLTRGRSYKLTRADLAKK